LKSTKLAFVFNGQGAQHSLMGVDLYHTYPLFKDTIDSLTLYHKPYFDYLDEESLASTKYMQPIIYTFNHALATLLISYNFIPNAVCGQSLGEYNALTSANVITYKEGLELTTTRGAIMKQAALLPSKMMAAIVTETSLLEKSLPEDIYISNVNSASQVVLGGTEKGFEELKALNLPFIKRLIPLNTEAAFHTPYMNEASQSFKPILNDYSFKKPEINLYQNLSGLLVNEVTNESLVNHINHPVLFQQMIENLKKDGIDHIVEIGPKSLLKKLILGIDESFSVISVYDVESFNQATNHLKEIYNE